MYLTKVALLITVSLVLIACASQRSKDTTAYRESVRNSDSYHFGFLDGCQVANYNWARQKQARRFDLFRNDTDYREGFLTGTQNCKDTVLIINTGKPLDHVQGIW